MLREETAKDGLSTFPWRSKQHGIPKIFCIPYAGASASLYRPWIASLEPDVAVWSVELPGRGTRPRAARARTISALAAELASAIAATIDGHYSLFGHSLGGLLAHAVTLRLCEMGHPAPRVVIISGAACSTDSSSRPALEDSSDAGVIEYLRRNGGTPREVLQDEDLMRVFIPVVRDDLALLADYRIAAPIEAPVAIFGGQSDLVVPLAKLARWRDVCVGPFSRHQFPGDHFFAFKAPRVLETIRALVLGRDCAQR